MASSGQTTHRAAAVPAAAQTDEANALAPIGFSTTDIPVGSVDIDTGNLETYNRGIPLCAISVLVLLIALGLIIFS